MYQCISYKTLMDNCADVVKSLVNKENSVIFVSNDYPSKDKVVMITPEEYDRLTNTLHVTVKPTEIHRMEYVINWEKDDD